MTIVIETIQHKLQRYSTVGDWQHKDGKTSLITISDMGDKRSNYLVAIHELVEMVLCEFAGISQQEVDHFDMRSQSDDPGDEMDAPYHDQHNIATGIERIVCAAIGMPWKEHEANCDNLG